MKCAVMFPTHNRREEARRTLEQLRLLDPAPHEILVTADGCSDGTSEMIRSEFPEVRLTIHSPGQGSIAARDRMMRNSTCEVVLSLDDDSHPIEPDALERILQLFEARPQLAVACFPQRSDEFPESLTQSDFGTPHFIGSYTSSGAALRRETFLKLGGYPTDFFHAYEEPDYSLRCSAVGTQVRFETSVTIRHFFTPVGRNEMRTHQRHARNEALSALMRCPFPHLLPVIAFRSFRQFGYACNRGLDWVLSEPRWWVNFVRAAPQALRARRPIPWRSYYAWMTLLRHPIFDEAEWQRRFPGSRS